MDRFDVKAFRERYGLSQIQLANKLGLTERSVRRWEVEKVNPAPNAVRQLKRVKLDIERTAKAEETRARQQQAPHVGQRQREQEQQGPRRRAFQSDNSNSDSDSDSLSLDLPLAAVLPSFGR